MELPAIYTAADKASGAGQSGYLRLSGLRLSSLLAASLVGVLGFAFPDLLLLRWLVFALFLVAVCSELLLIVNQPERDWYSGRAIAESVKTLAWRYAVGGDPFTTEMSESEASDLLRERIRAVVDKGKDRLDLGLEPAVVTGSMSELRNSALAVRRETYVRQRTKNQRAWYSAKAEWNAKRAKRGRGMLVAGEMGAIAAIAVTMNTDWVYAVAGAMAGVLASVAAWISIKQYSQLTSAYRIAATELALQEQVLEAVSEGGWPEAVGNAEEAISREHTMWLASRGQEPPPGPEVGGIRGG